MNWGLLPFDLIENVFRSMKDVENIHEHLHISRINAHWSAAVHDSPLLWRSCRYAAPPYTRIGTLVSAIRFMNRAPPGSMRSLSVRIDLWTCPEVALLLGPMLGKVRALIELLSDILRDQRETLESVTISLMHRHVSPVKMRRLIRPIQSSFFRLACMIEDLPNLRSLSLHGGIFPCRISRGVDFRAVWMVLELYPYSSKLFPKITITDISPHHFHMIMKCPSTVVASSMIQYVVDSLMNHARALHLYAEIAEHGGCTGHIGAEHHLPVSPGVIPFILAMRATNYLLSEDSTNVWETVRWRNRLAHPELAFRHGFFASHLPY